MHEPTPSGPPQIEDSGDHETEELLPKSNRIVVYGTRTDAAPITARIKQLFEENNIPEDEAGVFWARVTTSIEPAFFHRKPTQPSYEAPKSPESNTEQLSDNVATRGLLRRLSGVFKKPHESDPPSVVSPSSEKQLEPTPAKSKKEPTDDPFENTRPSGVLILPEMRYRGVDDMMLTVRRESVLPFIQKLCEENDVPYALLDPAEDGEVDIEGAMATLLDKPSAPKLL